MNLIISITATTVLPSQGMRALRKGSLSMKTLGWMKSTVLILSQMTLARVVFLISLSLKLLNNSIICLNYFQLIL